jgi:hypothetical protein
LPSSSTPEQLELDPEEWASKDLASAWLERAERLAGMPKQDVSGMRIAGPG